MSILEQFVSQLSDEEKDKLRREIEDAERRGNHR